MMHGTRKPRPIGPGASFSALADEVMYSPGVPAGAVGGVTWSKSPSLSSQVRANTVLAKTSGFDAIALSLLATKSAPAAGMKSGCSDWKDVGMIHDTVGSRSLIASYSNWPGW